MQVKRRFMQSCTLQQLLLFLSFSANAAEGVDCKTMIDQDNDLTVHKGQECEVSGYVNVKTLMVRGTVKAGLHSEFNATTNILVDLGGEVSCKQTTSPGIGRGNDQGSGGGYGGRGGNPANQSLHHSESIAYGQIDAPLEGSQGGGDGGGYGGGAVTLTGNNVNIFGIVICNGQDGTGSGSGGGSGGSVVIAANTLSGTGAIFARGGRGSGTGGGGGGGRVTLKLHTSTFTGQVYADGGIGGSSEIELPTSITASSTRNYYPVSYAYLKEASIKSWRPSTNSVDEYLVASMNGDYFVTSLQLKGGNTSNCFVKTFNIQYFNASAASWGILSKENYIFSTASTAGGDIATVDLPWPLFTSKVKINVVSYSGCIEMSIKLFGYVKGGAGGPGTVFYQKTNEDSTIVINNFGKPANIKANSACTLPDVLTQGAAAYITHEVEDLQNIVLHDCSHVVLHNQSLVNVLGGNLSTIHVAPTSVLIISLELSTSAYVYSTSSIHYSQASTVTLKGHILVDGDLAFYNETGQDLVLKHWAALSIFSTTMTEFRLRSLHVQQDAELVISKQTQFSLKVESLSVDGKIILHQDGYNRQEVSEGFPVTSLCNVLGVDKLTVNGKFITGQTDIGTGIDYIDIQQYGNWTFTPCGTFHVQSLTCNGTMISTAPLRLEGRGVHKVRTIYIGSSGSVTLDSLVQDSQTWTGVSDVGVHEIEIYGIFRAGRLRVRVIANKGWNTLNIYLNGALIFEPSGDFLVDTVYVKGIFNALGTLYSGPYNNVKIVHFTITGHVNFSAPTNVKGDRLILFSRGVVDLAYQLQPDDMASGSTASKLLYRIIEIYGTLKGGSLFIGPQGAQNCETLTVSGTIDVSGGGYLYDNGPGRGHVSFEGGSGGSHGGRGGRVKGLRQAQGVPYGSLNESGIHWGSGGGSHMINGNTGGRGGGYIYVHVTQTLSITGIVKANGQSSKTGAAGGGSGGSVFLKSDAHLSMTGTVYCNGGSTSGSGGGGAGGRVQVFYDLGDFYSSHIQAKGGSSECGENGGPGVSYIQNSKMTNLRIDNGCLEPTVTELSGERVGQSEYAIYMESGAIAFLQPSTDFQTYEFTYLEIYGSAHLALKGNGTKLKIEVLHGDNTGHIHIATGQTMEMTRASRYIPVTVEVHLYDGANWIMPESIVDFKGVSDQHTIGMASSSNSCPTNSFRTTSTYLSGNVDAAKTTIRISTGSHVIFGTTKTGIQDFKIGNLTVHSGGSLEFISNYGNDDDISLLEVRREPYPGQITIESGGSITARNFRIDTDSLKIYQNGVLDLSGKGLAGGVGAGKCLAGGSFGGLGSNGSNPDGLPGPVYGSLYNTDLQFGSGGSGALSDASVGKGGGILELHISETLLVEGSIEVNGATGSSTVGGGSGGAIRAYTRDLEGSGSIEVSGGNGGTNTGAGGGGRLVIYYKRKDFWFGKFALEGGSGSFGDGEAGTVILKVNC